MHNRGPVPMELFIHRVCQRYHKLPSEVLEEDWEWVELLLLIDSIDSGRQELEQERAKMRMKANAKSNS